MSHKDLSNLLTRANLAHVSEGRQGVSRRLDLPTVRLIDILVQLVALGVSAAGARALAVAILAESAGGIRVGPGLGLTYDARAHEADLAARLRDAAERVIPRRRGRPRSTPSAS